VSVWNVLVDEPADVEALLDFLRVVHVRVAGVNDRVISVSLPGALSAHHEYRELLGYVTTWNALNPERRAELVEP
jgi:hypothetical protein